MRNRDAVSVTEFIYIFRYDVPLDIYLWPVSETSEAAPVREEFRSATVEEIGHTYRAMCPGVPIFVDFRYSGARTEFVLVKVVRGGGMWYTGGYVGS